MDKSNRLQGVSSLAIVLLFISSVLFCLNKIEVLPQGFWIPLFALTIIIGLMDVLSLWGSKEGTPVETQEEKVGPEAILESSDAKVNKPGKISPSVNNFSESNEIVMEKQKDIRPGSLQDPKEVFNPVEDPTSVPAPATVELEDRVEANEALSTYLQKATDEVGLDTQRPDNHFQRVSLQLDEKQKEIEADFQELRMKVNRSFDDLLKDLEKIELSPKE
jgi:hypothetical protein